MDQDNQDSAIYPGLSSGLSHASTGPNGNGNGNGAAVVSVSTVGAVPDMQQDGLVGINAGKAKTNATERTGSDSTSDSSPSSSSTSSSSSFSSPLSSTSSVSSTAPSTLPLPLPLSLPATTTIAAADYAPTSFLPADEQTKSGEDKTINILTVVKSGSDRAEQPIADPASLAHTKDGDESPRNNPAPSTSNSHSKSSSNSSNDDTLDTTVLPAILLPPVDIDERAPQQTNNPIGTASKKNITPQPSSSPAKKTATSIGRGSTGTSTGTGTGSAAKARATAPAGSLSKATTAKSPLTTLARTGTPRSPPSVSKASTLSATGTPRSPPSVSKASTLSATGSTSRIRAAASTSSPSSSPASSLAAKTTRTRPAIPASMRAGSSTSTTSATSTSATNSSSAASTSSVSSSPSSTLGRASSTARTLSAIPSSPSIRKSPSTSSLASTPSTASSSGRRVASTSGVVSRPTPASKTTAVTPTQSSTRSLGRASTVSTSTSASAVSTPRRTPTSSTNTSPSSTLRQTARTISSTTTPTSSVRKTMSSAVSSTRPSATEAARARMRSSQMSGIQEKHDQTLKLLQEQEARLKMQLEEMTVVPEHERKPIPSDVQEILKEMEDLRAQFKEAKVQHEQKLEELAAERTAELAKINETHEVAMNELTRERDSGVVTFKALQESSALSDRERTEKIAELENQIEDLKKTHAELIEQHAIALEDLRKELESTWTARLETRISELEEVREEALAAAEAKLQKTGVSKEVEIKTLKDSFTEKMQALEHEQEDREVKLTSAHEQEIQDWKDQLTRATEDHRETMDQMQIQLKDVRTQLKKKDEALEETLQAKQEVESEFDQYRSEMKEQMDSFRTELEAIQKLLMDKEAEARELENKVQELTDDLENTSISSMLKNTKKYKVKEIHIYGSTVSGNLQIKRAQQSISDTLEQLEISYDFVDISSSEDSKRYMRRKNGGDTRLPQIFSGGEYRGTHEEFQYAVETHQILQFLGFDRVKPFVGPNAAPHSSTLAPNSTSSEFKGQQVRGAQHGEDAEQGAGQPNIVVNGVSSGPSGNAKDIATSMYLMSPGSTRFQSQRSLYAPGLNGTAGSTGSLASYASSTGSVRGRKSGFVQAASQVWNGALKEESGLGRHDLGFHTIQGGANNSVRGGVVGVLADDDELDELFEQGAVTEAELEAMLASGAL